MEEEVDKDGGAGGRRGSKSGGKYSRERRRKESRGGSILMNTGKCWYQGKTCTNMTLEFLTNLLAMPKTESLNN